MRNRGSVAVGFLALAAVAGCSSGDVNPRGRPTPDGLISGTYTFERPEVGSIDGCTATLVGPRLVITAAHCVDFQTRSTPGRYNTFVVDDGTRQFRYTVDRIASFGGDAGDDDVALLHLAIAVPVAVATPARIGTSMPPRGTTVITYGYGCQDRDWGSGEFAKQRFEHVLGRDTYNLCPGDSGGPTMTEDGHVLLVNSAYIVGEGTDIFGDVVRNAGDVQAQATAWGAELGAGDPSTDPALPPEEDPGTPPEDPGLPPEDPGLPPEEDPGTPPEDPGLPPEEDPGTVPDDCASATTCEEATPLAGCGWCGATGQSVAVDGCGYPIDDCPGDFRLTPEDCDGAGGASSGCVCTDGVRFTCAGGAELECPLASLCIPGTTELECWGW